MSAENIKDFSVSVVILATDENKSLIKTVKYIEEECEDKPDRVIIVLSRNAAADCVAAAESLQSMYPSVSVTVQEKDGLGQAALHGIKCVETTHMIFFPADLAIELESIDRMLSEGRKDPSVIVKTSRWLQKDSFVGYNKLRYVLNFMGQIFLRAIFCVRLTDLTNPVQLIPVEIQRSINWREDGFCVLLEQTIVPVRLRYKMTEVPAKCLPRSEGKSKNSWIQILFYLKVALKVRFSSKKKLLKNSDR